MSSQISRATVVFSCLGHLYIHLCTAFFFVIGLLVASVYTAAAFMQVVGGHLADRFPSTTVYIGALLTVFALAAVCVALLLPRARGMAAPQLAGAD